MALMVERKYCANICATPNGVPWAINTYTKEAMLTIDSKSRLHSWRKSISIFYETIQVPKTNAHPTSLFHNQVRRRAYIIFSNPKNAALILGPTPHMGVAHLVFGS